MQSDAGLIPIDIPVSFTNTLKSNLKINPDPLNSKLFSLERFWFLVGICLIWKLKEYIVVITTAQLHSTMPELRFYAGSNPAHDVLEIRNGEDLWRWSQLEIKLNAFCRSTLPQKQIIIIIIIIVQMDA